jgi:hypothetical protein
VRSTTATRTQAVVAAVAAAAFAVAATGCRGYHSDKAGGRRAQAPVVLTLATQSDLYAQATFAKAVERLSGGSMHIKILGGWREAESDYERGIVRDAWGKRCARATRRACAHPG